jgi:tetratricopeptide (TPR) repeat protein
VPLGILAGCVGPVSVPKACWSTLGLPLLLLPLSQAGWLNERRLGLETGDEAYLQAALRDGPKTERAHFELAEALYARGRREEAVVEWRTARAAPYLVRQGLFDLALAVDPQDVEAREGAAWTPVRPVTPEDEAGRAAELVGDDAVAEQRYQVLAAIDPVGYYRLGELYARMGMVGAAVSELEQAVRLIPNQEDFRLALAHAYQDAGSEKAIDQYRAVSDLDPGNWEARLALHPEQAVPHDLEAVHRPTRPDRNAVERVFGDMTGNAGNGGEQLVDITKH